MIHADPSRVLGLFETRRDESGSQLHLVPSVKCQIVDQTRFISMALMLGCGRTTAACDMKGGVAFVLCELKGHAE